MRDIKHALMLVGGRWVEAASGARLGVEDPARREMIAEVPRGSTQDVDNAVDAAATAFPNWRAIIPRERGRALLRISEDLERRTEEIARSISRETGNAIRTQARPEATTASDIFRYFGGLASELKGETIPLGEKLLSYVIREPFGVVGAIIPWNTPVELAALKIAPAICAGNTIVLKAAEDAPLSVLMLAEVCQDHLPAGVVNVITGLGEECGGPLVRHPRVSKLSFTGSTEVGKIIMQSASERIVPVSLELGGKSPSIVFPDADEEWVADGVIAAMRFTRQSQACTAGSRLYVHAEVFDTFMEKLVSKLSKMRIGNPLDEQTDIGTLINQTQFQKVCDYVSQGLREPSVHVLIGGLPPATGPLSAGYYVLPTIFTGASNAWRLAREEIFGPVLVAIPWRDEAEVVRMANDSHYGLAAYVWTHDIGRAVRAAHAIEAGWIQINQGLGQFLGQPYGGYKQSGIGRECSLDGMLDSFTQRKNVTVNLSV